MLIKSDFLNEDAARIYLVANNEFMSPPNFTVIPYVMVLRNHVPTPVKKSKEFV